jgi:hypothetical protein
MTYQEFIGSLADPEPPQNASRILKALWHDHKNNWQAAHEIAQERNDPPHCLIHAYLHRKEGDLSNAKYWYDKANRKVPQVSLADEWEILVKEFVGQ